MSITYNTKKYVTKVVGDENGDLVILFPEELIVTLSLLENEVLEWQIAPDGKQILINRPGFIYNSKEKE